MLLGNTFYFGACVMEASLNSFIVNSITVSPLQTQQVSVGVNISQRTQSESKSGLSKATSSQL